MKLPISWLKEYVDVDITVKELADKFSLSGSEVEHIENARHFDEKIIVGEILEIKKHPNADRLNLVKLKISNDQSPTTKDYLEVVCGATNLEVGIKVPLAMLGVKLGDFEIKEAEIRGIVSRGMICTEQELGLAEHSEGVMILDSKIKPGTLFNSLFPSETVLDLDITPNRQDCLSIIGLAREASTFLEKELKIPEVKVNETSKSINTCVEVKVSEKDLCPRYMARIIKIKDNGESPEWIKKRLLSSGVRPINKVVDVTNYVMLETGEPMHGFDFGKLNGKKLSLKNKKEIVVRAAKKGEKIVTLDGKERALDETMLVIADSKNPIAIAGIMGGFESGTDSETKEVFLEAGIFDYLSIRKTSRKLALRSESSARFEKGLPLTLPEYAVDRAATLIAEICDGEILKDKIDILDKWIWTQHIGVKKSWLNNFIGQDIPEEKVISILTWLGFKAEKFDIVEEAKRHLGKPYKWGASFKTDGNDAFDCGYLVDYIYSLIGKMVGHSAPQILDSGKEIELSDLKPGDTLFRDGIWKKVSSKDRNGVSHVAMYIGNNKIIHAEDHHRVGKKWEELPKKDQKVRIDPLDIITKDPQFIGARRHTENLNDYIAVTVPWWRPDVSTQQDIAEEVTRIFGFGNIPPALLKGEFSEFEDNERFNLFIDLKKKLAGLGFSEVYNYSFLNGKSLLTVGEELNKAFKLENPANPDQEYFKTSLLPQLLGNVALNQANFDEIKIFEISNIFEKSEKDPVQERHLAAAYLDGSARDKEFFFLKGAIENIGVELRVNMEFKKSIETVLEAGKSADIFANGKKIGFLGIVKDDIKKGFGIKKKVAIFDINLEKALSLGKQDITYRPFSKFPSITRDLAFVLDKEIETATLLKVVSGVKSKEIKEILIKDIYEGKELEGKKSVTISVIHQSFEKTLKDEEVMTLEQQIIKAVKEKLKGSLR